MAKSALDKDLKKLESFGTAAQSQARPLALPGLALVFLLGAVALASIAVSSGPFASLVIVATAIGGYMALNIGANDVANNVGPAVGARALKLAPALAIAALAEIAGAVIASQRVVDTVAYHIVPHAETIDPLFFILAMMAAFLGAAAWINIATVLGAPVSTTHSIVGGIVGASIVALGTGTIDWPTVAWIAAGWIVSPLIAGFLAAAILAFIGALILEQDDRLRAARRSVPILIAVVVAIFVAFTILVVPHDYLVVSRPLIALIALLAACATFLPARRWVVRRSTELEGSKRDIARLFALPLAFTAAILSFAHGANDVGNAVGPLVAIIAMAGDHTGAAGDTTTVLPFWALLLGGGGIATGIWLFGPRVIRTVGQVITRMNELRAFAVALATASTVLIAASLGLPVSTTHIAVGAVFGIGFLREYRSNRGIPNLAVSPRAIFLRTPKLNATPREAIDNFQSRERRRLVRRRAVAGIVAGWAVTLPAASLLSILFYLPMAWLAG